MQLSLAEEAGALVSGVKIPFGVSQTEISVPCSPFLPINDKFFKFSFCFFFLNFLFAFSRKAIFCAKRFFV